MYSPTILVSYDGFHVVGTCCRSHTSYGPHVACCTPQVSQVAFFLIRAKKVSDFTRPFLKSQKVHPWKLTWNPKMEVWKMIFLFYWVIFRFHVNFPGCSVQQEDTPGHSDLIRPGPWIETLKLQLQESIQRLQDECRQLQVRFSVRGGVLGTGITDIN